MNESHTTFAAANENTSLFINTHTPNAVATAETSQTTEDSRDILLCRGASFLPLASYHLPRPLSFSSCPAYMVEGATLASDNGG